MSKRTSKRSRGEVSPENRDLVTQLYEHHAKWINIVRKLDRNSTILPEDIVSDFYETMLYYGTPAMIQDDGSLNEAYIYIALRNAFVSALAKNSKLPTVRLEDKHLCITEETDSEREAYSNLCKKVETEMTNWDEAERELFDMYFTSGRSFRELGEDLETSWTSLYYIIKHSKQKIKDSLGKDYEDFLNGDYEFLKDDNDE